MKNTTKNEAATKGDIREVIELLNDVIDRFDERFNTVEFKLTQHDDRFDSLDHRFDEVDRKFTRLMDTMDSFVKQIQDHEAELAARDHKIARMEAWVEAIAKKTGVPMPADY